MTPPQDPRDIRIMHMPWNVGGHAAGMAAAQRQIGLNARSLALVPGGFGFRADETLLSGTHSAYANHQTRSALLRRAISEADVVHYSWGEPLFAPPPPDYWRMLNGPLRSRLSTWLFGQLRGLQPFHDLRALRRAGKVIAVTFLGDDLRQGQTQLQRYSHSLAHVVDYYAADTDRWKQRVARAFIDNADILFAANPDLLRDLPPQARFLPYATVNPSDVTPAYKTTEAVSRALRIVHAPSDRIIKGTAAVIAAVETLASRGHQLELDLVENVPNTQARARMAEADIVIDQLNAGFYGTAAVEAMALGKPVIAFMRTEDLDYLPPEMRADLPLITTEPGNLAQTLEGLLRRPRHDLADIGRRSRRFTETWHDPSSIARETAAAYQAALARRAARP